MTEKNFIRLVYRKNKDGVFCRSNGRTFLQDFVFLPWIGEMLHDDQKNIDIYISKVYFTFMGNKALAWIDKHGNLIIRYYPYKQTKINF